MKATLIYKMNLNSMGYITLNQIKKLLKIEGDDQDKLLTSLIEQASAMIDNHLWYSLLSKAYTEFYPSRYSSVLFVSAKPITEVISVKNERWEPLQVKRANGNAIHLTHKVKGTVEIEYKAGYESVELPKEIVWLCGNMVKQLYTDYNADGDLDIKQKKIDTLSITYFSKQESIEGNDVRTQGSFDVVLAPYEIYLPMAI